MRAREEDISMVILRNVTLLYQLHAGNMTREMTTKNWNMGIVIKRSLERRRSRGRPVQLKPWSFYDETGRTRVPTPDSPPKKPVI